MKAGSLAFLLILVLSFCSCKPEPQPINFGSDNCEFCKMTIVDNKYGAELITKKGKIYKFDSVECMIRYMKSNSITESEVNELLIIDHTSQGLLTDAASAYYLLSDSLHSPMGAGLTAFSKKGDFDFFKEQFKGEEMDWQKVFQKITP